MITMMLGGRAAEEIVIHDISTGASNDIQRASDIARNMVTEWGMSTLGNIYLGGSSEVFLGRDYQKQHSYSEQIAGKIDEEVKRLVDEGYVKALDMLKKNKTTMENMVKLLFEKETIYAEEVDMLFKGVDVEEIIKSIDEKMKIREEQANNTDNLVVKETELNRDYDEDDDKYKDADKKELKDKDRYKRDI